MKPMPPDDSRSFPLDQLAHEIYESLARRFPICLGSDEFHFFPHYRSPDHDWSTWDDFSPESVEDVIARISQWESKLSTLSFDSVNGDFEAESLGRLLTTLREQLTWVCSHKIQPTFYLTIASLGLAEALDAGAGAFARRVAGLPEFLDRAIANLNRPPDLYRDMGLEMADRIGRWLAAFPRQSVNCLPVINALKKFTHGLMSLKTEAEFLLPPDLYAHMAKYHMDCRASLDEIEDHMSAEIEETEILLDKASGDIRPGASWRRVLGDLKIMAGNYIDPIQVFEEVIDDLHRHCHAQAFLPADFSAGYQVRIEEIPDSMRLVRSDAAFSMPPGHPPGAGIFYILPLAADSGIPADYRLLAAHETYPGHQLLDTSRWLLPNVVMRSMEFPIFYEGWASFSEEILFDTGFFSGSIDHLLMAKRRYWRAQRGLIDLRIHTGNWDLSTSAEYLTEKGLPPETSRDMVRRYALKPGYQLAYTMGRRRFQDLYACHRRRGGSINSFVRSVMGSGEAGFEKMEKILNLKEKRH